MFVNYNKNRRDIPCCCTMQSKLVLNDIRQAIQEQLEKAQGDKWSSVELFTFYNLQIKRRQVFMNYC